MKPVLTPDLIERARALRREGKSYKEIHEALGLESSVLPTSLRYHCSDIPVDGKERARQEGAVEAKDGRTIRYFSTEEDEQLIAWANDPGRPAAYALADQMGRKRVSILARVRTLQRLGRIPADLELKDGRRRG